MANNQNLRRGGITTETASELGKKGAEKSAESRRNRKLWKEALEILLEKMMEDENGEEVTGSEAISASLFNKALAGDTKAFEIIRDTIGQKPVEKVLIADVDSSVVAEVEAMVNGTEAGS